uniref:Protein retinal degeneration B n=1 Tax=Cacopsylla melanoneura TaxID=428564 RepID=A0A8D8SCH5_9HEMI
MLIKEYRIPLPLTVDEYKIAQLFMIAKKSREESSGAGSGVEILYNEPYENDEEAPGTVGQKTVKVYHVGSHLPGWIKSLLPKSALEVKEEAWNAYPFTKTVYWCDFVKNFKLEITTKYLPDDGSTENVFNLTGSELRSRIVEVIDVVKDQLYGGDYVRDEDPSIYVSEKTGRGPLSEDWISEHWETVKGHEQPHQSKSLMCAYKLCKVQFHYWGMQTKLEKFVHDFALRRTMLRAHRQAWAWQDEWDGLTIEDIRKIERETAVTLKLKMSGGAANGSTEVPPSGSEQGALSSHSTLQPSSSLTTSTSSSNNPALKTLADALDSIEKTDQELAQHSQHPPSGVSKPVHPHPSIPSSSRHASSHHSNKLSLSLSKTPGGGMRSAHASGGGHHSPSSVRSYAIAQQQATWRMESIVRDSEDSEGFSGEDDDDEFFDAQESMGDNSSLAKWSSMELLHEEDESPSPSVTSRQEDSIFSTSYLKRAASERGRSMDRSCPGSPTLSVQGHQGHLASTQCRTSALLIVMHAGSVLDANVDMTAKKSDTTTFRGAFESVIRQHYPSMMGRVAMKLVACPPICTDGLSILSSLSPYSFDVSPCATERDAPGVTHDSVPIGAIPLLVTCSKDYSDAVTKVVNSVNQVYQEFVRSEEGLGFNGIVSIVGDSMGSVLAYDALCRSCDKQEDADSVYNPHLEDVQIGGDTTLPHLTTPTYPHPTRRRSSSSSEFSSTRLEFEVHEFFMFGSPLSLVLAYRKMRGSQDNSHINIIQRPPVQQVYNLFHPTDPIAVRLEPLISARFSLLAPVNIPRYQQFPLGNGQPYHLLEVVHQSPQVFSDNLTVSSNLHLRRLSEVSIVSNVSGVNDNLPLQTINALTQKWWGGKRIDYALYCPEGLANFPTNALPHLFHASFWESCDVIAFILRQIGRFDMAPSTGTDEKDMEGFNPGQPREKWMRKRTSVKIKNATANHRANDIIVKEGLPQTLVSRFMYGPFDMFTLTGEKVDVHLIKEPPSGEWILMSTEVTDKTGRVSYTLPEEFKLSYGMYPVKMVVRGDHTSVDFYLAVVPPRTEVVVFSVDGSFTASVSVTGRDPKVRAGAVDIVRHWQELGYLIIYITGRPDMQQGRVLSWLSQHNFPHGLVSFADGLSPGFLGHKASYLKSLIQDHGVVIHAAYGSNKDVSVYTSVGLKPRSIYIVGKVSKKHQSQCTVLSDGYAAHLTSLQQHGGSRPAQGNARMVLAPKGYFGHNLSIRRRRCPERLPYGK